MPVIYEDIKRKIAGDNYNAIEQTTDRNDKIKKYADELTQKKKFSFNYSSLKRSFLFYNYVMRYELTKGPEDVPDDRFCRC